MNKTAGVAMAAEPGQILASDATRALVVGDEVLQFDPATRLEIRSLDDETFVSTLHWQRRDATAD